METSKVEMKQIQKIGEVVTYLEGLLKGFKEGKIVVQQGDNFVSLVPTEQVVVEVSAKRKKNKDKFSLELSWQDAAAACAETVKITAKEPACAPKAAKEKPLADKTVDAKVAKQAPAAKAAAKGTPAAK